MRKYAKLALCGLAAVMVVAGCSKKDTTETTAEGTAAETTAEGADKTPADLGKVTKLGTYKGVEVEKMDTQVTDEELEAELQRILASNPEYSEVTDRPAKEGDVVNIDYVGMKDGVAFDGGTAEGYDLELGSGAFIDGFEDGLIGANKGSELSLNLTFPEEYHSPELAGQDVVFDVTVNSIEEKKDAVLDDNFVQRMSDFNTVEEYKADTLVNLEKQKEDMADIQLENDAFMAALETCEFEVNEDAIEEQYQNQYSYYTQMVQMYGMELADYVSMLGMTEEEFQDEIRNAAELSIKQNLLVKAVAEAEKLEVEDADRQAAAAQYGMDVENMVNAYGQEALDESAMLIKVATFIKDNAVIK